MLIVARRIAAAPSSTAGSPGGPLGDPAVLLGAVAILLATINIAGGFLVTQRMLKMFRR